MKNTYKRLTIALFIPMLCLTNAINAQTKEQQEMQQVLEMMKASGVDQAQIDQMENMLKSMMKMEIQRKGAKIDKEKEKFDTATAGYGSGMAAVEGKRYALTVTKCEVRDRKKGAFTIQAKEAPGLDGGELSIYSDGISSPRSVSFSTRIKPYKNYHSQNPDLQFDGKTLIWEGLAQSESQELPFSLNLSCGSEAVYYDQATRAPLGDTGKSVTLYLGADTYSFQAGRCTNEKYRTGNLMVDFEVTAAGDFRGRPAIVLLSSSHGVGEGEGAGPFHNFELLLGEITEDQRSVSPIELKQALSKEVEAFRSKQLEMHQKKYSEEFWATVTPENINQALDASSKEMNLIMDRADAMVLPSARSVGGNNSIDGQNAVFRGPAMQTSDADRAPQLQNLEAIPEVHISCSGSSS
ncbi:MAG: hypothetical protein WBM41_11550 [Arenicellales bacterium]